MNIKELQKQIIEFRNQRNWKQFHTIKDLLLGLNIEVGELQEHFLWLSTLETDNFNEKKIKEISDELADIFIFLIYISEFYKIDLTEAVKSKIEQNGKKYPIRKSKNNKTKYTEL